MTKPRGVRSILGGRARNLWRKQGRPSAQPTAQPVAGRFVIGGRARTLCRNQWQAVSFSAAEHATHGASNSRPFYSRRPNAQPTLWRSQWQAVRLSAAERAPYGATNGRPFYYRRPSAQAMVQPVAGRFILGGAKPDTCSPFWLTVKPKLRAVFVISCAAYLGLIVPSWRPSCVLELTRAAPFPSAY